MENNLADRLAKLVLNESTEDIKIPMMPISEFNEMAAEAGFSELGDFQSNGWQVDFWNYYRHSSLGRFVLHGSLYYGDFAFGKADEETEDDFER